MVKFILIKSPEWATTKQACIGMNVHVVYLFFSSMHIIYSARSTFMYWALFYRNQILHLI